MLIWPSDTKQDKKIELFPRVIELLSSLKKNYLLCVASNSDRRFILKILQNTNLLPYFKCILTVNDVKKPKPSPDIYLLGTKRMALQPAECIVIEDSTVGIEAAKNAGMKCIAISHTLPKEKLKEADLLLEEISVACYLLKFIKYSIQNRHMIFIAQISTLVFSFIKNP